MRLSRRFCLLFLAVVSIVLLSTPTRTTQPPIGILTLATHAKLNEATAFVGLSVFEGERLSTEAEGRLGLRTGRSEITLGGKTQIELIHMDGGAHVDMEAGSIHFSSEENEIVEVHMADAMVRPASAQPTQASVALLGPKVLQIAAEHGTLHFTYRDEQRNLPEGQTYRIYLDADDGQPTATDGAQTAGTPSKLTYFIVSGGAAAAVGGAAWAIDHALHSSNPPISPAKP
jgi:hypothetical protein